VDKLDDSSFIIINLQFQFNNIFNQKLLHEEKGSISSIEKINLLFYRVEENKNELAVVENILSKARYQNLMDLKFFLKAQVSLVY
tara:strand:+ start:163 stop:417 length:255 start_codon:yes stop_codon:yes gene_type:complete